MVQDTVGILHPSLPEFIVLVGSSPSLSIKPLDSSGRKVVGSNFTPFGLPFLKKKFQAPGNSCFVPRKFQEASIFCGSFYLGCSPISTGMGTLTNACLTMHFLSCWQNTISYHFCKQEEEKLMGQVITRTVGVCHSSSAVIWDKARLATSLPVQK